MEQKAANSDAAASCYHTPPMTPMLLAKHAHCLRMLSSGQIR
jgi:hypothetical protein